MWTNLSQLDTSAAGKSRSGIDPDNPDPELSVLIEGDDIWVGVSRVDEFERIPKRDNGYDWEQLQRTLAAHKASTMFAEISTIQIAANSTRAARVDYQALVGAMDVAKKAGFSTVNLADVDGLAARPHI